LINTGITETTEASRWTPRVARDTDRASTGRKHDRSQWCLRPVLWEYQKFCV
jgi:hypothetical protein